MTALTAERTFQRPETIPIWVEVKDWTGTYVDPDQGVTLTLTNPSGTVIVNASAMTKYATGKYVYYYTSSSSDVAGWWRAVGTAQDGTGAGAKYTISYGGFYLQ